MSIWSRIKNWFDWDTTPIPNDPEVVKKLKVVDALIKETCEPIAPLPSFHFPPVEFDSDRKDGDLNDNELAAEEAACPENKPMSLAEGNLALLPGGVVFDREEFKKFSAEHPEYAAMQKQWMNYKVAAHNVDGAKAVGISLHGAKDPGPKALLDALTKKEDDKK